MLTTRACTPCSASIALGQHAQLDFRAGADQDDIRIAGGVGEDVAAVADIARRAGAVEDGQILAGEDQSARAVCAPAPPQASTVSFASPGG